MKKFLFTPSIGLPKTLSNSAQFFATFRSWAEVSRWQLPLVNTAGARLMGFAVAVAKRLRVKLVAQQPLCCLLVGTATAIAAPAWADDPEKLPPPVVRPKPTQEQALAIEQRLQANLFRYLTDETLRPEAFLELMGYEIESVHQAADFIFRLKPIHPLKVAKPENDARLSVNRKLTIIRISFDAKNLPNEFELQGCISVEAFENKMIEKKYLKKIWPQPYTQPEIYFETSLHPWISRISYYGDSGCLKQVYISRGLKGVN